MKKDIILLLLISACLNCFSATWTVTNAGWHFTPDTLIITFGDSVNFAVDTTHHVVEISQSSWIADDTTPLPGFSTPMGGGLVLSTQLTAGTHWYICPEHFAEPMKGVIIVQTSTGITALNIPGENLIISPSPASSIITLQSNLDLADAEIKIMNALGEEQNTKMISSRRKNEIDISGLNNGIYFLLLKSHNNCSLEKFMKN